MSRVEFLPEVVDFFEELAYLLHEKCYFGNYEFARKYVDGLIDDIKNHLPTKYNKPAPTYFDKYGKGMKYAVFRKNKQTSWYTFFKTYNNDGQTFFLVRYIANNHVIAKHL
jgi:hypothetical protein